MARKKLTEKIPVDNSSDNKLLCHANNLYFSCKSKGVKTLDSNTLNESFTTLESYFGIDRVSCLILTPILYNSAMGNRPLEVADINEWLGASLPFMGVLHEAISVLLRAGIVSKEYDRNDKARYAIKQKVLTSAIKGRPIPRLTPEDKTLSTFLEVVYNTFESYETEEIEDGLFFSQIDFMLQEFSDLQELKFIKDVDLTATERSLLLLVAYDLIINDQAGVDVEKLIKKLCPSQFKRRRLGDSLLKKENILIKKRMLSFFGGDYISLEWMTLGDMAAEQLQGQEMKAKKKFTPSKGVLIHPEKQKNCQLFYNNKEQDTFSEILYNLTPDGLDRLFQQYKTDGAPENLTVLLQGGPGVGKTSTVYSLAQKTNRVVFRVEIDKIHDMFVGESEKNISKIFSEYERLKSQEENCPILLLNECDNLLKSRIGKERSATDQMANNLTTMMLEKMENFSGILFATVNEIQFDIAFNRRFLYRIEMTPPDEITRLNIITDVFPDIPLEKARAIAQEYALTGANIQNIHKKFRLQKNAKPDLTLESVISELCKAEIVAQKGRVFISGFQVNASRSSTFAQ